MRSSCRRPHGVSKNSLAEAASWHKDLSSRGEPGARELISGRPAEATRALIWEIGFGSSSPEYSTNFLYIQRPPRWRRHTIPQTSRPAIDRRGMITRQRCQASDHVCPRSGPTADSVLLPLAIIGSPQRYPETAEPCDSAMGTSWQRQKCRRQPCCSFSCLQAAVRRSGTRRRNEGASTHCFSCRCARLPAPR